MLPGLPAYIIFMMIRHTDHVNDENKFRALMNGKQYSQRKILGLELIFTWLLYNLGVINAITNLIKKKSNDPEYGALWLTNITRLLHNFKQYSGDRVCFNEYPCLLRIHETFLFFELCSQQVQDTNTSKQNSQALCHFDLVDYHPVICDVALWTHKVGFPVAPFQSTLTIDHIVFQVLLKAMIDQISNLVIPAVMGQDAVPDLSGGPCNTASARSHLNSSAVSTPSGDCGENNLAADTQIPMENLKKKLDQFLKMVTEFRIDSELIVGIFKEVHNQVWDAVFYFMNGDNYLYS